MTSLDFPGFTLLHSPTIPQQWWQDAVIYQVYPRSFASSRGAVGDIPGVTSRLGHLSDLGVDAVWLSPFYRSPQRDAGYDVEDYRDIDPMFGTMADVDALIARAHSLGLRVIFDIVPNHERPPRMVQAGLGGRPRLTRARTLLVPFFPQ